MKKQLTYNHTIFALFFSNFFQAIGSVFPIFLVSIRNLYGLSYTQFGLLVGLNFITQVSSDILFSKPVDKFGFRPFAIASPIVSSLGLFLYALTPTILPGNEFIGFCISIFIFAAAGGLQELLLSPILDSLPLHEEKKARNMSLLHSFFAWGQIFVVLTTTILLTTLGAAQWQFILAGWAIIPLISALMFCFVPLKAMVEAGKEMPLASIFKDKIFLLSLAAILFGGASEVTMSQWASVFLEQGLDLPKLAGDTIGVCGFSLMMAIGRTAFGTKGKAVTIHKIMTFGSLVAAALYVVAALSPQPFIGLVACGLTGLSVSMLWPGAVMVSAKHLPLAGASMFALLSASGDVGAALSSFVIGKISDNVKSFSLLGLSGEQASLRVGLLCASIFAIASFIVNIKLKKSVKSKEKNEVN